MSVQVNRGLLVHQGAPSGVDQVRAGLDPSQGFRPQEASSLGRQGEVKGNEVGPLQDLRQGPGALCPPVSPTDRPPSTRDGRSGVGPRPGVRLQSVRPPPGRWHRRRRELPACPLPSRGWAGGGRRPPRPPPAGSSPAHGRGTWPGHGRRPRSSPPAEAMICSASSGDSAWRRAARRSGRRKREASSVKALRWEK